MISDNYIFISCYNTNDYLTITNDKITGWLDGESVLFAVFVVVNIEFFTNWQKEQFYELSNIKSSRTFFKAIRINNIVDLKADFIG